MNLPLDAVSDAKSLLFMRSVAKIKKKSKCSTLICNHFKDDTLLRAQHVTECLLNECVFVCVGRNICFDCASCNCENYSYVITIGIRKTCEKSLHENKYLKFKVQSHRFASKSNTLSFNINTFILFFV